MEEFLPWEVELDIVGTQISELSERDISILNWIQENVFNAWAIRISSGKKYFKFEDAAEAIHFKMWLY
jgi:hypothetical protein